MSKSYVLAQAYAGVQFWNADKSDLIEVRRQLGEKVVPLPDEVSEADLARLLKLGAIVEAAKLEVEEPEVPGPEALEEPAGNAGRDEWAAYADSLGLTVEPNAKRDDIKALVAESRA